MKIKQLLQGWKEIKLGELIKLRGGFAFRSVEFVKEGVPLVRISNFNNDEVDLNDAVFVPFEEYEKYPELQLKENDLLIAMSGATTGKVGIISKKNIPCLLNQRVGKFEILDKNLNWKYLYLFIKSKKFQSKILSIAGGCAQPNISGRQIESVKILLPPLSTQQKIVSILEKAEQLKEKRKKSIEVLDEYLKSVFSEMFLKKKFEEVELGEICKIVSGSTPSTQKEEYWNGAINWVTPAELIDGMNYYYCETKRKISEEGLKSCSAEIFPPGTVMLTTRAPIGKVAIAGVKMCSNQGFKNFIPSKKVDSVFLYFWFLRKKEYLNSKGSGATFKELSKKAVSEIKIPLPSLELQQQFSSIVKHVEKLKEKQRKSQDEVEELFDALMQKAFRGELVK